MRLLHTSDWHLGRSFHQVGLLDAQKLFLDHLVDEVTTRAIDVVLVAGDVYDRALPAPQTVELLDEALLRLTRAGAQVVLAAGNHDSAVRLGFGSRLLSGAGVHLRTRLDEITEAVEVGGTRIYALPYLEPSVVAPLLGVRPNHREVMAAALALIREHAADFPGPVVVSAHLFVTGAEPSDSERDITVGGIGDVPMNLFEGFDYVALGHLHGRQQLAPTVRYSGSPVAMSFSEVNHTKGSWLVELGEVRGGQVAVEAVDAPVHTPLAVLTGSLDELLADPALEWATAAWCKVVLTDDTRPLDAMEKVRARFPKAIVLEHRPLHAPEARHRSYTARVRERSDAEVVAGFFEHVRGAGLDEAEQAVLQQALEGARLADGRRAEHTPDTRSGR